jgi:hypothetical protein
MAETLGERIVRLEAQILHSNEYHRSEILHLKSEFAEFVAAREKRVAREWILIMAVLAPFVAYFVKVLGFAS